MQPTNLKEFLKDKLTEEELKLVPKSFDVIGSKEKSVAIVEIPEELVEKEKLVAEAIMKLNKSIKSVLKKASERKGELRLREYELLAGDKNTEVTHIEYGCLFRLDPRKVYFSPRELTERQRIASKVKPNEVVMLMFAGVGAYAVFIAKKQPKVKIISVELNSDAFGYMEENIRINKLSHLIVPVLGDVREKCKKWYGKCDRIIMPLPMGAESFLDVAINCLKDKGMIHFYSWGEEKDPFSGAEKLIEENVKKLKKKYEIIEKRKVLPYAPRKWKVCIDFKVIE